MGHLSLSNSAAVHLWVQVAALFVVARVFGVLARRAGQPVVVGSLLGGVLLGPSVLGAAWPRAAAFMLPVHEGAQLLGAVTGFCLLMLLVVLGAETNPSLLRDLGRAAVAVSAGSIVLPLVAGVAAVYLFADVLVGGKVLAGALLVGGALGVSSLPVIARLVSELGVVRRNFGQLAFAAATVNDIYGFLLLVAVTVLARSSGVARVAWPLGGLALMLVLLAGLGQRWADALLRRVRLRGPNPSGSLTVVIGFALVASAGMQVFGVEAALGAFFAGVIVGRSRFQHSRAMEHLQAFSNSVFAPIYFAAAGLQVDLLMLNKLTKVVALLVLFAVAIGSKALGVVLSARSARLHRRETAALAVLLNGRGAMQVILGTAGLRMGLLSSTAYTVLLVVSIISSMMVAPALRRVVGNWPGSEPEKQRLAHEERLRGHILVRAQRLLVPCNVGGKPDAAVALLDRAWPTEAELTLFGGTAPAFPPGRPVRSVVPGTAAPAAAVIAEANLGYGVVGIGTDRPRDLLVPDMAMAELLNSCPLPLVAVVSRTPMPTPRRVAVAVTGTAASLAAEELAHGLCAEESELVIVHVTPRQPGSSEDMPESPDRVVVDDARQRALDAGIRARVVRRSASGPTGSAIAAWAGSHDIDVLVVGTRLRRVRDRPFLGHTVERLLYDANAATLVVVALPESVSEDSDQPYADRQLA